MRYFTSLAVLLLPVFALADGPQVNTFPLNHLALPLVFCGEGANADDNYLGPGASIGADLAPGGTACDALDSITETTADAIPYGLVHAYTVVGMICQMTDTGTNDTVTFTLGDDTADVTGFSCGPVTLNGAGTESCSVYPASQAVAAASAMAVRQTRSDDDDLSTSDAICVVFVRY